MQLVTRPDRHHRICVGRSINGFGLSPGITKEQRLEVEGLMKKAFAKMTGGMAGLSYPLQVRIGICELYTFLPYLFWLPVQNRCQNTVQKINSLLHFSRYFGMGCFITPFTTQLIPNRLTNFSESRSRRFVGER